MPGRRAKKGDSLLIHYTCHDEAGELLESTKDGEPPRILLGRGDVLKVLEKAFCGMEEGETKHLRVPPEQAFGEYDLELVDDVPRKELPLREEPYVGMECEFEMEDGEVYSGIVSNVEEDFVTIDANHPLAGRTLLFDLELVKIL